MSKLSPEQRAGETLRWLIQKNYPTQEAFAYDYGVDLRTLSRYINTGITKVSVIDQLSNFFQVELTEFFLEH